MLAIIDYRAPKSVINSLSNYVNDILLFKSEGITYNSISGHPDIFIYQDKLNLIIAPNSPTTLFDFLNKHKVNFQIGNSNVGNQLKDSVQYNCLSTEKYLIHKSGFTDKKVLETNIEKEFLNIPQAYTRCSLTHLKDKYFITSDKGIQKELTIRGFNVFFFAPDEINIVDHKNGFIGGTNGIKNNKIFFMGSVTKHQDGEKLIKYLEHLKFEIINLGNDFLYDGGGLFFV